MARARAHVVYSGRVQGVGFRYTARRHASGFAVTGYVRNLPRGTVELEAEGERAEVQAFLADIESSMHGLIREAKVSWIDAVEGAEGAEGAEGERGFSVRF